MADTFAEIAADVRAALSVSSTYDTQLTTAVRGAAGDLLKDYNFPKSVIPAPIELTNPSTGVQLDTDLGKIKGVRLFIEEDDVPLYKVLRRREVGVPPAFTWPTYYSILGEELIFDYPLTEDGYTLEIWHQSISPAANEGWLCQDWESQLFNLGCMRGCIRVGKPDLLPTFAPFVDEDKARLAIFLNEIEWGGSDLQMGSEPSQPVYERYNSGQ